jgi:hypothetical protein
MVKLKMEAVRFSETSKQICRPIWCNKPDHHTIFMTATVKT